VGAAEPRIRRQARGFRGGALAGLGSGLWLLQGAQWVLRAGIRLHAERSYGTCSVGFRCLAPCPSKSSENPPEGLHPGRRDGGLEALGKRIKRGVSAEPGERKTEEEAGK
jgi:hypothetical protein